MKQATSALIWLALVNTLLGQPAFNHQFFPRIGHSQVMAQVYPEAINPGLPEPGQVWDFSGLEIIPGAPQTTVENMSPGLTPFGDAFPEANVCGIFTDTVGFYAYYKITPDGWDWIGSGTELGALPFTDPLSILRPMAFNGSFRDTARMELVSPGLEYYKYIEQEVGYRSYGTLRLPQGNFYNVVMIEMHQMEIDSFSFSSEGFYSIDTIFTNTYNWMQAGTPGPICIYQVSNGSSKVDFGGQEPEYSTFGPEYDAQYDIGLISSADGPGLYPLGTMALAPNPAQDNSWLYLQSGQAFREAILEVRDSAGRLMRAVPVAIDEGENKYQVPVEGLPAGLYLVILANGKATQATRLVVR